MSRLFLILLVAVALLSTGCKKDKGDWPKTAADCNDNKSLGALERVKACVAIVMNKKKYPDRIDRFDESKKTLNFLAVTKCLGKPGPETLKVCKYICSWAGEYVSSVKVCCAKAKSLEAKKK